MPYVVLNPEASRRVYATWEECKAAIAGVSSVQQMYVETPEEGEQMLMGGVRLEHRLYAFTDGNHTGGVGVVIVRGSSNTDEFPICIQELSSNVVDVLTGASIPTLDSIDTIESAVERLRNIIAEMTALYAAIRLVPVREAVTVVHDYRGVELFWTGAWNTKDAEIRELTEAAKRLADERESSVSFREQRSHKSAFYGRHDYRRFNARADELASGRHLVSLERWTQ
jgi:hypothetical protein